MLVLITNGFPALTYAEVEEDRGKECEDCWASFEREREAGSGKSAIVMEDIRRITNKRSLGAYSGIFFRPGSLSCIEHVYLGSHRQPNSVPSLVALFLPVPALTHFWFFAKKNGERNSQHPCYPYRSTHCDGVYFCSTECEYMRVLV